MRADKRFSESAIHSLKEEIQDASGNEVFALGFFDSENKVATIKILARGHEAAVLAPSSFLEEADVLIHNHPSSQLSPSDNDLAIASRVAESGIGSYIVDNAVSRVYVVVEARAKKVIEKLDADKLVAALEEGGAIARRLDKYESRKPQLDLLRLVARSLNEDAIVCAEAGTGVGKSFAYLVPVMSWAQANDERVVVSTATINLQQQLFEKDIPLVSSAMRKKVKAVLLKGRSNYLCLRRLYDAVKEGQLFPEEGEGLEEILAWAETSQSGSRSDLSFLPQEAVWSRVCSEPDLCLGLRCPERDRCFFLAVKRDAADAGLLVVNHHLLFADLAARYEGGGYDGTIVLPPFNRVVIDEAHSIEEAASSFFSKSFGRLAALKQLGRIYRRRRGLETGLALRLLALNGNAEALVDIAEAAQDCRQNFESLDESALTLLGGEGSLRLRVERIDRIRDSLFENLASTRASISKLVGQVRAQVEYLGEDQGEDPVCWEIKAVLRRLEAMGSLCGQFLEYEVHSTEIFWLERLKSGQGDAWVRFTETPLDVGPSLRDALFEPNSSVICVSATMTVADSFSYWLRRSGAALVSDRSIYTGNFPSPFPYKDAVLLASASDAPLPEEESYQDFVNEAVERLVISSGGSALILFTSYEALRGAYAASHSNLEASGIHCFKQGDDDRSRLLKAFQDDESSVLFATDSFWEGVDAPGDTLRLVILCRLPFRSPNDPVFEARREALEKRGGNAFMEMSLPEAVMKFKQGFGRLMRRSSDRGAVVVLDSRILKKRYGSIFIKSLPETRQSFENFADLLSSVDRFLS